MEGRKSFLFLRSYFEAAEELDDKDRLAYLDAICRYGLYGELPELSGPIAGMFKLAKPNIDTGWARSEAGRAGGIQRAENQAGERQAQAKGKQIQAKSSKSKQRASGEGSREKGVGIQEKGEPPSSVPPEGGASDGFDRFWSAYPWQAGKQAALKEWSRLAPDDELTEALVAAVEYQRTTDEWTREGGRFVPKADKWLRERRWEDEHRRTPPRNRFCNFDQRSIDYDALIAKEARGKT